MDNMKRLKTQLNRVTLRQLKQANRLFLMLKSNSNNTRTFSHRTVSKFEIFSRAISNLHLSLQDSIPQNTPRPRQKEKKRGNKRHNTRFPVQTDATLSYFHNLHYLARRSIAGQNSAKGYSPPLLWTSDKLFQLQCLQSKQFR